MIARGISLTLGATGAMCVLDHRTDADRNGSRLFCRAGSGVVKLGGLAR